MQVSGGPLMGAPGARGAPHVWVRRSSQGSVWWCPSSWERFVLGESIGAGVLEETRLCSRKCDRPDGGENTHTCTHTHTAYTHKCVRTRIHTHVCSFCLTVCESCALEHACSGCSRPSSCAWNTGDEAGSTLEPPGFHLAAGHPQLYLFVRTVPRVLVHGAGAVLGLSPLRLLNCKPLVFLSPLGRNCHLRGSGGLHK